MPRTAFRLVLLLLVPLALAACEERLTDPEAIADRIAEEALANYEDVRDFTVHGVDASGEGVVVYFRRTEPDSLAAFEGRAFSDDSLRTPVALPYALPNAMQIARGLRANARLAGTVALDGDAAYVLEANDPGALIGTPGAGASTLDSIRVLVDAETFHIREVRVTTPQTSLDPEAAAGAPPLVQRQRYSDFRSVSGLALPFHIQTTLSGVAVPAEVRMTQGPTLEIQRRAAEQLPSPQRERALRDLERQLRLIRDGAMDETFTVSTVQVNAGIPEGTFGL